MHALVAKIQPDKVVRWCRDDFLRPIFSACRVQHVSDLHSKFALMPHHSITLSYCGHSMCGSMVDIQSPTAEIRRGKKEIDRRKKPQGKNIMSASATQGGHKNSGTFFLDTVYCL